MIKIGTKLMLIGMYNKTRVLVMTEMASNRCLAMVLDSIYFYKNGDIVTVIFHEQQHESNVYHKFTIIKAKGGR